MVFLVLTIDIPFIFIDTTSAMIGIYFYHVYPEKNFIEMTLDYDLLKMKLALSIT
jgi:hypothetical protein